MPASHNALVAAPAGGVEDAHALASELENLEKRLQKETGSMSDEEFSRICIRIREIPEPFRILENFRHIFDDLCRPRSLENVKDFRATKGALKALSFERQESSQSRGH